MSSAPDSSDVLNAVIAFLGSDTALLALMPNNVYEDEAPDGSTRFVIVSHVQSTDNRVYGRIAFEEHEIVIEARSSDGGDVGAAAARVQALLDPDDADPPRIPVPGMGFATVAREGFLRTRERGDDNPKRTWRRRGGHYRVTVSHA